MSVYDEWLSVYDEWLSLYDEWLSVYDEWIQWVLDVCKDMNGDCVWRMLGECKRLLKNKNMFCHVTLQIIMCDNIQLLYTSFWK